MPALLSILIPTLQNRAALLQRLMSSIEPHRDPAKIVILKLLDRGQETTGRKRQRLLEAAQTPYVAFVDDDDDLSPDYFPLVLAAMEKSPDVVGFKLAQFDGKERSATAWHSVDAKGVKDRGWWSEEGSKGQQFHYRWPNHLNPIRTEIARAVGYSDKTYGEDSDYSMRLRERFPALVEEYIPEELYLYLRRVRRVAVA